MLWSIYTVCVNFTYDDSGLNINVTLNFNTLENKTVSGNNAQFNSYSWFQFEILLQIINH